MYTSTVFNRHVRDAAAPYGGGWLEREEFPAEGVLRDLRRRGSDDDIPRIVARYSAIRFVLLRHAGAPPALVDHARAAAAHHLAAVADPWPEGETLRRLIGPAPLEQALAALAGSASDAEAAGHVHGAYAARRAAYWIARRRLLLRPASELAREMAAFLERHGEGARARVWRRRAARLSRLDGSPPSAS